VGDYVARDVLAARNGRNQQDAVAVLDGTGFAPEEADVFVVEIYVQELANLSLIVAHVAAEVGKFGGQLIQGFGNRYGTTIDFGLATGKSSEGRWDFDDYWHICCSLHLDIFYKTKILK
jgi:hypothetical protein